MNPRAIGLAIGGGLIGALLWGAIAAITNYELGLVAWAIGGLVGGGAVVGGGRGRTLAGVCAAIAAVAIIGGKLAMSMFLLDGMADSDAEKHLKEQFTMQMHSDTIADAAEFGRITDSGHHTAFMISHGYDGGDGVVSPQELADFRQAWVPLLTKWSTRPLAYEEARDEYVAQWKPVMVKATREEVTHADVVMGSFGPMDILFFGLGVFTAFGIVAKRSDEDTAVQDHQQRFDRSRPGPGYPVPPGSNNMPQQAHDAQALPQDPGQPSVQRPPRRTTRPVPRATRPPGGPAQRPPA